MEGVFMTSDKPPGTININGREVPPHELPGAFRKLFKGNEDEYHRELGRIAVGFSRVELGVPLLLGLLCGLSLDVTHPLFDGMTLSHALTKIDKIIPLTVSDAEERGQLAILLKRIKKASERRNNLLHALWMLRGQEVGLQMDRKTKTKRPIKLQELTEFGSVVETLAQDLAEYLVSALDRYGK